MTYTTLKFAKAEIQHQQGYDVGNIPVNCSHPKTFTVHLVFTEFLACKSRNSKHYLSFY